jgi:hypothetical protein
MISGSRCASAPAYREFDLHLHVLEHHSKGAESRYTLGIWKRSKDGAGIRAICHASILREALLAIAKEFDKGAERDSAEIKYPRWSEIAPLVRKLNQRGDEDSRGAAEMLEDLQARLHNATADLDLTVERLARLGILLEDSAAKSQLFPEYIGGCKLTIIPQRAWLRLLATYRDRQEGACLYRELQALREIAGITAETLRTVDDWLGNACTREAAMESLWRLRRVLESLGYAMPLEHLAWRGQIIRAMEEAGLGLGADGAIRIRQPRDRYWEPATGAPIKEVLQSVIQTTP